uniref:Uncharacterized protein n=1 Tax=Sphaerodactylus townsendi TaxID=933632 RepID=A0ACB8FLA3_9SAUR
MRDFDCTSSLFPKSLSPDRTTKPPLPTFSPGERARRHGEAPAVDPAVICGMFGRKTAPLVRCQRGLAVEAVPLGVWRLETSLPPSLSLSLSTYSKLALPTRVRWNTFPYNVIQTPESSLAGVAHMKQGPLSCSTEWGGVR